MGGTVDDTQEDRGTETIWAFLELNVPGITAVHPGLMLLLSWGVNPGCEHSAQARYQLS